MDTIIITSLEQGLAYGIMALGIVLTFRFLDFPDLTVEGSFVLGASVSAKFISIGFDPILAIICAMFGGFISGCITGILHTKLRISKLLSGVLMMVMLFSINLRIMGRPNIPLLNLRTITDVLNEMQFLGFLDGYGIITSFLVIGIFLKMSSDLFLYSNIGTVLRATGDNERVIKTLGINTDKIKILGVGLSNLLIALSGSLISQYQGFADVSMGIGMIVIGIASIIIGESLLRRIPLVKLSLVQMRTFAAFIGSMVYQTLIILGLRMGLAPTDLKLATGIMIIMVIGLRWGKGRTDFPVDKY